MNFEIVIGVVALAFSVICFIFFVVDAIRRSRAEEIVRRAQKAAQDKLDADNREAFNPAVIAAVAKPLADAFTKAAPGVVALIGSILFLLLAGEATNVYNLTGGAETNASTGEGDDAGGDTPDTGNASAGDNQATIGEDDSTEPVNQT